MNKKLHRQIIQRLYSQILTRMVSLTQSPTTSKPLLKYTTVFLMITRKRLYSVCYIDLTGEHVKCIQANAQKHINICKKWALTYNFALHDKNAQNCMHFHSNLGLNVKATPRIHLEAKLGKYHTTYWELPISKQPKNDRFKRRH